MALAAIRSKVSPAHPDLYLLSRLEVIIGVPVADVVARQLAAILRIELVPAVVGIPCGLRPLHLALHLPVALRRRRLADAHHEIDREHCLGIVAERAHQFRALDLRRADPAHRGAALIGQSLAEIDQYVASSAGECISLGRAALCSRHLGQYVVFRQAVAVKARRGGLLGICRAVFVIVRLQIAGGGHRQERTQFGTAHSAERHMGISGEKLVVKFIRGRPPSCILVIHVLR